MCEKVCVVCHISARWAVSVVLSTSNGVWSLEWCLLKSQSVRICDSGKSHGREEEGRLRGSDVGTPGDP